MSVNALPSDLPPRSTVWAYLDLWDWDGTIRRIHDVLYVQSRKAAGRDASPTTAIIDAQSAKGALKGGRSLDPSGYDAGKKVLGRKRHVLVDTLGLLLSVDVHAAQRSGPGRGGGAAPPGPQAVPLHRARDRGRWLRRPKMTDLVRRTGAWTLEIVKRSDLPRFVVLPKRWIVERTLGCISRNRRLMRDYERHTRKAAAFVRLP